MWKELALFSSEHIKRGKGPISPLFYTFRWWLFIKQAYSEAISQAVQRTRGITPQGRTPQRNYNRKTHPNAKDSTAEGEKRPREWYNLDRQTTVWKWREIWRPVRKISFHFLIIFAVESPESLGGEWGRFIDCYRCGFVAEGGGGDGGGGGGADLLEILAPGSAREPSYRTFYVLLPGDSINLT